MNKIIKDKKNVDTYQIVWLLRRLFRALGNKAGQRLESIGITAAHRACMEFLYPDKALTVPQIASKYNVSRQHIQTTVNELVEKGYVLTVSNPSHKRSPLIKLTDGGAKLFGGILKEDKQIIDKMFSDIPREHIRITTKTLETLLNKS